MKILKGLLSLLLCLCLITPMGSAIVALNEGGIANMGSQTNSGSPTSAPSETPAPSDTDTPVEAPDYAALYNDLMAAATFAEAHALLEGLTDEQLSAFIDSLTEEQYAALEEHIDALIAAAEEDGDLEYVYTTVNFTNVAPLLDPVCGSPTRGASVSGDDTGSGNGDSGMVITKNAVANGNGTYTVTLEAYATGSQIITEVTEDIPTDIVLVLDQSGSMDDPIGTVSYSPYPNYQSANSEHYDRRHNGGSDNLYYTLDEKAYFPVSVTVQEVVSHSPIDSRNNNNSYYWYYRDNLYALVNGEYMEVTVLRTSRYGTYTYSLPDGTKIGSANGRYGVPTFSGIDGNHLYLGNVDETQSVYTYTYTDSDGNIQTIGTSTGADTTFDTTLYQRIVDTNGGGSRLNALKNAVTAFADAVAEKAKGKDGALGTNDDVNHRIAMVGFASGYYYENGWNSDYYYYGNTEVFVGASQYTYNAGSANNASNASSAQSHYSDAFQDMDTTQGQTNITASIGALDANGGTLINLGMEMANGILNANPVQNGEKRNRVIIVFTDGTPGWSGYDSDTASAAISQASTAKENGVTVYTVGIFSGADATSAGNSDGNDDTQKANWFMQKVSSNNGTVQNPSYYLSAADADALNDIFQQISDQIETGGSSTTLSEDTVIRDIIAPAFTLPKGATADSITLETYACIGKDGDVYTWNKNDNAMGAEATIFGSQVSVTGFDFAENYVGPVTDNGVVTSYRGHKLVIRFTVSPKADFLGGNNVYTNANAGVYENSTAINPVLTFERPQVNVPIGDVSVTASEQNVYLLNGVTLEQLKEDATVTVGGVTLNLTASNYGLESWQTEYVDISVVIKDASGNTVTADGINGLTADTTYSITVTVAPTSGGTDASGTPATAKTGGTDFVAINVFKPVLTFADSEVWYGDNAPNTLDTNLVEETWINSDGSKKHDDDGVHMLSSKPTLTFDYATTPVNAIVEDYIVVPDDIPVNVLVKIGGTAIDEHVSFVHADCSHENCGFDAATCEFILHVNTCSLTVEKAIAEGSQLQDSDQSFIFKVSFPGIATDDGEVLLSADYNVLIVGAGSRTIVGLPVGTYTVSEDTHHWSWRYTLEESTNNPAVLSAKNSTATVTMTNKLNNEFWLSDEAVATNVFDSNGSGIVYNPTPAIIPGKEDLTDEAD